LNKVLDRAVIGSEKQNTADELNAGWLSAATNHAPQEGGAKWHW